MAYELKTEKFEGPLEKLLELIEAQKLAITEVSLATVTDGFFAYLELVGKSAKEGHTDFSLLADFISVASKLVLIKSKSLLPSFELTENEEADIKDLEARLRIYQHLKLAMKTFGVAWAKGNRSFSRPYLLHALDRVHIFSPGRLTVGDLVFAIKGIFNVFQKLERETETIKEKIVSLEEKIQEVIKRVSELGETTLKKLSSSGSKSEVIVLFLSLLHLAREQLVFLEQQEHFSDIMIKKSSATA